MTDATPKKTATPKAKKAPAGKKTSSHPSYKSMIKKAISTLNEKGGSSKAAIVKYISANYKVGDKVSAQVKTALKRMLVKKEIVHASSKSHGASGSFKLPAKEPKAKKPAAKKVTKSPAKKTTKTAKSPKKTKSPKKAKKPKVAKKPVAKKPAAKKPPAKK